MAVLVLLPPRAIPPPEELPVGRAALALGEEGVRVLFGSIGATWEALPGRWARVPSEGIDVVFDRFPYRSQPEAYKAAIAALGELPQANPVSLRRLCFDKARSQTLLEAAGVPMPALEQDPSRFEERLRQWGAAFIKPRWGQGSKGIEALRPGDPLPSMPLHPRTGEPMPALLQRAVPPPPSWAGACLRVLMHRDHRHPQGWVASLLVGRCSRRSRVASRSRGDIEVLPAEALLTPGGMKRAVALTTQAARALAAQPEGEWLVELGMDLAVDPQGEAHLIEVNSRPALRLLTLAREHAGLTEAQHLAAYARPLRALQRQASSHTPSPEPRTT